jgi:hypothetical protein
MMLTIHPEIIRRCRSWRAVSDIGVRIQAHASGHRNGLGRCDEVELCSCFRAFAGALLSVSE